MTFDHLTFRYLNKKWVILAGLILAGMAFSVWDYKKWRWEETHAFGQGPAESTKSQTRLPDGQVSNPKMVMYQNDDLGIRIKYPEGWKVSEGPVIKFGDLVSLRVEETAENLIDITDREAARIVETEEKQYVTTEFSSITVISWAGGKTAMTKNGNKLVRIDSTADNKIFQEMIRSLVFF